MIGDWSRTERRMGIRGQGRNYLRSGPPRRRLSTVYLDGVVHACAAALVHPSVQTASPYHSPENLLLDIGYPLSRAPNGHLLPVAQAAAPRRRTPDLPHPVLSARPAAPL